MFVAQKKILLLPPTVQPKTPIAQLCLICGNSINKIGGRQMIRALWRGTKLSDTAVKEGSVIDLGFALDNSSIYPLRRCSKLFDYPDLYLIIWGGVRFTSKEVITRAREDYLAGTQPWFCQKCGYRTCSHCGEPGIRLHHSDYVFDGGGRGYHHPPQHGGGNPGCINLGCEKYHQAKWRTEGLTYG